MTSGPCFPTLPLGEVARMSSGGTPRPKDPRYYEHGTIPWAVIGDLNDGHVSTCATHITGAALDESSAKVVPEDTVLVAMYGSIGKLGYTKRAMATNQAIAALQPHPDRMNGRFLFWQMLYLRPQLQRQGLGVAQKNISQGLLRQLPIVVPPLEEQCRIVAVIEEHLARLDAAERYLAQCQQRRRLFVGAVLQALIPSEVPSSWLVTTVGDVGRVDLGRQRHPDWHQGPDMRPYLRVANVFEDRLDLRDVKSMDFSAVGDRFTLQAGDVLLNEGQSPELLGRPALYRGEDAPMAFTNSLLRFRAGHLVLPEWALLVFRRHMHSGRFRREARITTNIAHLSAARLKAVEFPVPSLTEQSKICLRAEELLSDVEHAAGAVSLLRRRRAVLRSEVLKSAFSGGL